MNLTPEEQEDRQDLNRKIIAERDRMKAEVADLKARFTVPIVCMCGSTRFKQSWISENARLTGDGNIVLAVGLWGHHEQIYPPPEIKKKLDELHKLKVRLCDWVWVLDVGGYIGESTRGEIAFAESLGRTVRYLSKEFPDYCEPTDLVAAECDRLKAVLDEQERRIDALEMRLIEVMTTEAKVRGCGIALHDFIRANAGETPDWPLRIASDHPRVIEAFDRLLKEFKAAVEK